MRNITSHIANPTNDKISIEVLDDPGSGGANHVYDMVYPSADGVGHIRHVGHIRQHVTFQNGPIAEAGVNGTTNEALLAILIDRMQGFQSGQYKCRENAIALTHLEEALMWLQKRTRDRMARGVEGTLAK